MKPIKRVGLAFIVLLAALAMVAQGPPPDEAPPDDGGGGPVEVETSEPFGETEFTSEPFGETEFTSEPFGETEFTGGPFGETSGTGDPFGESFGTFGPDGEPAPVFDPQAAAEAQDFLGGLDFDALTQSPDGEIPEGFAQALIDLGNYQDLAPDASQYALQNAQDLQVDPSSVVDLLSNLSPDGIDQDVLQQAWQLPSADDYVKMPVAQAQSTLAQITANFTIELELGPNGDYLGLVNAIANQGALVEAAAASALANILDPDTLADAPLTEEGLQNLVASVSGDLSDAFLDAAQIITADFGIADFTEFTVDATLFDTLDYSDTPELEVNPLVLQLFAS